MLTTAACRKFGSRFNRYPIFCYNKQTSFSTRYEYQRVVRYLSPSSLLQTHEDLSEKKFFDAHYAFSRRQMATAYSFAPDDIPFDNLNGPPPPLMGLGVTYGQSSVRPGLGSMDFFNYTDHTSSEVFRRGRLGLSGDSTEIIPVFEACVHVGRLERARSILEKLQEKISSNYEVIRCTNIYLRAAVEQIMMNPKNEIQMQDLHRWFKIAQELRAIPTDSKMIAYMLKLSLQSDGERRERLVRKYMELLNEESFLELIESDILTGQETSLVTKIFPKYNFTLDPDEVTVDKKLLADSNDVPTDKNLSDLKIRETVQKGLGLSSLKGSLSLFSKVSLEGLDLNIASYEVKREVQKQLEEDAVESAIHRWKEEYQTLLKLGCNPNLLKMPLGPLMWDWHTALEKKVIEEIELTQIAETAKKRSREELDRCSFGPLLQILPSAQLSAITIITSMTMMGQNSDRRIPLTALVLEIGKNIEDESALFVLQKSLNTKITDPSNKRPRLNPEFYKKLRRSRGAGAASNHMSYFYPEEGIKPWPAALKAKVGATLISHLIDVANVSVQVEHSQTKEELVQIQPAFTHAHQYKKGKKTGVVMMNQTLIQKIQREPVHSLIAKQLPMILPPKPWTSFRKGGYIVHPTSIMRIKNGDNYQRYYCEAAITHGNMHGLFEGLDVLGNTAWRINKEVYRVMLEAWNTGKAIANLPPLNPQLEMPPEPLDTKDPLERGRWIRQIKIIQNIKSSMHSQRCMQNFQLEIARAFLNIEFYQPHNIDFRGRAYTIHPYLNHIGADHCRGLLIFAVGKELGEMGIKWLKIHLSNVFGFDKASLEERELFTSSKMEEIYDSANHPMTGNQWWLKAEDPWQCLAACFELRNALESPDPKKYVSNLPIHQDGTCNGLQHYAALGGDVWGAKQVNLEPGPRPGDVYSAVAELVRENIARDKKNGLPIANYLEGKITRKTVKQTVMTNVYGVTFIGATAQVRKQLVAANPDLARHDNADRMTASLYVSKMIFRALSTMFRGAHNIQNWLGECAERISASLSPSQLCKLEKEWSEHYGAPLPDFSKSRTQGKKMQVPIFEDMLTFKNCITWTSPIGLPVVQPYRQSTGRTIRTVMQNLHISEPCKNSPVSKRKQLQGFPPNFIHSLDASHMLLSAIGCSRKGLSFAAVHDSFWTHACDIDTMNKVLREKFIKIHTNDIIGRLKAEFESRYQNFFYLARIKPSDSLSKRIAYWRKKMRARSHVQCSNKDTKTLSLIEEVLLEYKKAKLLSSSDPIEVLRGKEIETPASIYNDFKEIENVANQDLEDPSQELASQNELSDLDSDLDADLEKDSASLDDSGIVIESDELDEAVEENCEMDFDEEDLSKFEKDLAKPILRKNQRKMKPEKTIEIWLPVSFPKVPEKASCNQSNSLGLIISNKSAG